MFETSSLCGSPGVLPTGRRVGLVGWLLLLSAVNAVATNPAPAPTASPEDPAAAGYRERIDAYFQFAVTQQDAQIAELAGKQKALETQLAAAPAKSRAASELRRQLQVVKKDLAALVEASPPPPKLSSTRLAAGQFGVMQVDHLHVASVEEKGVWAVPVALETAVSVNARGMAVTERRLRQDRQVFIKNPPAELRQPAARVKSPAWVFEVVGTIAVLDAQGKRPQYFLLEPLDLAPAQAYLDARARRLAADRKLPK